MKQTPLTRREPLRSDPEKVREFTARARRNSKPKRGPVSPASMAQRLKVRDQRCVVCGADGCDPAHLIDRSLCSSGADDARAVVALCRICHRDYDEGRLSLLEHLEPAHREELAFAVFHFGLMGTVRRVTGTRDA